MDTSNYYNRKYYNWQKSVGEFGGKANLFKFEKYIEKTSDVLDFGCGGGYLLANINTQGRKIGIEVNPVAREEAKKRGIECLEDITKVDDASVDVLISNHALEHVDNPCFYINEFKRVIRPKGKIVLCVPHETNGKVNYKDSNMHLYTWSPQNLYNLLTVNGFKVNECHRLCHAWIPNCRQIQSLVGWNIFNKLCILYSKMKRRYQVIAVATKRNQRRK